MAAREAAKSAGSLDELRAILEKFDGCALKATATQTGLCRRQSESAADVRRRSARPRRGHRGPALRRPLRQIARPHAGGDRARPHSTSTSPISCRGGRRAIATPTPQESRSACPSSCGRSNWSTPIFWSVSASRRRRHCSASMTASPRRAAAGFTFNTGTREIRAMPTFHPAFLLRSPLQKRFAWRDFLAVKKALSE